MVGRGSVRAGFPGLPRLPGALPRISRPNGKRGRSLAGFQSIFRLNNAQFYFLYVELLTRPIPVKFRGPPYGFGR
jgi:hypothetical protein